jgi:hypothetical protein
MIFFLWGIVIYLWINKKSLAKVNNCSSGCDERPIYHNEVDIQQVKLNLKKWKLLQDLTSPKITDVEKVKLIQMSHMLDDLIPYTIKGPDLLKGLKSDFTESNSEQKE